MSSGTEGKREEWITTYEVIVCSGPISSVGMCWDYSRGSKRAGRGTREGTLEEAWREEGSLGGWRLSVWHSEYILL